LVLGLVLISRHRMPVYRLIFWAATRDLRLQILKALTRQRGACDQLRLQSWVQTITFAQICQ